MTTTAQALDALQQAAICYCGAFTSQPFATLRQHIESTAAEIARLQAECEALRKDAAAWKKLYHRAINEANGLTNYVEDRPELRRADRNLSAIEADARALSLSTSTAPSGAEE